jgi:hypothetical protein
VENKVKARQQAEKVAQKEANKIKQKIEKKEKGSMEKKKSQKGRGSLQREKKRARKEEATSNEKDINCKEEARLEESEFEEKPSKKQKMVKPPKKQKRDRDGLDVLINEYKSSFTKGVTKAVVEDKHDSSDARATDRSSVAKKRWFE